MDETPQTPSDPTANSDPTTKSDRTTNVLFLFLVVLALVGGVGLYLYRQQDVEAQPEPARPDLSKVVPKEKSDLKPVVPEAGSVDPEAGSSVF